MLISEPHKFIFIHVYKTAGSSMTRALFPYTLTRTQRTLRKLSIRLRLPFRWEDDRFPCHVRAKDLMARLGETAFRQYFSFAIVRNPWDWQVSLYKFMLKRTDHPQHSLIVSMKGFDEYIRWRCEHEVRFQKDFICSDDDRILVDFVGRFESLDTDFRYICERIGVDATLPKINVSNTKPYRDFYNAETRALIEKAFEPDIELFDYEF